MSTTFSVLGVFFLLLLSFVQSRHVNNPFGFIQHLEGFRRGQSVKGLKDIKSYLAKYGYFDNDQVINKGTMKKHTNDDEFDDLLESAIKKYQHMYGLKVTGGLDSDTVKQMMKPRCGVPDFFNGSHNHHHHGMSIHFVGHYKLYPGNPKWPSDKTLLTYRIRNSADITLALDVSSICARAFQKWSGVLYPYTFEEVSDGSIPVIEIDFHGRQALGSNDVGFDGPHGVMAHATRPGGTTSFLHFDADEIWGDEPETFEADLESIALHEMGHALGLDHSSLPQSVMYAYFDYGMKKRDLTQDDIDGLRNLYG